MYACVYIYIYIYIYTTRAFHSRQDLRSACELLDAELTALISEANTLLLGYSFETDARKLIESFPGMQSLQALSRMVDLQTPSFLDVQDLIRAYLRLPRANPMGLSAACARVLGAKLDKTSQVFCGVVIAFVSGSDLVDICVCLYVCVLLV